MSRAATHRVAEHLGIAVADYDRAIRSFVPQYETMLDAVAEVLPTCVPARAAIVDLGIGSGALAERCLWALPRARIIGIDADQAMLEFALARLPSAVVELRHASFTAGALPRAHAFVASLSLHHISRAQKPAFYRRLFRALTNGGVLISADCYPPATPRLAKAAQQRWRGHVGRAYSPKETARLFRSWSREDEYVPLDIEIVMMARAGFQLDVAWRWAPFAVIVATKIAA